MEKVIAERTNVQDAMHHEEGARESEKSVAPENKPGKNGEAVEVKQKTDKERAAERNVKADPENDNSVYDNYTPAKLKIEGAKPHPADLVQSTAVEVLFSFTYHRF
jgi:hypothetical protein